MSVVDNLDESLADFEWTVESDHDSGGIFIIGIFDELGNCDRFTADQLIPNIRRIRALGRSAPPPLVCVCQAESDPSAF